MRILTLAAALLAVATPALAAPPIPLDAREVAVDEVTVRAARRAVYDATEKAAEGFRDLRGFGIPRHVNEALLEALEAERLSAKEVKSYGWVLNAQRVVCGQTRTSPRRSWQWFWASGRESRDKIGGTTFTTLVLGAAELMTRTKPRLVRKFFSPAPFCMPDEATVAAWAASNAMIEAEVAAAPEHCNDRGACLREFPVDDGLMAEVQTELRDKLEEPTFVRFGVPRGLEDVAEGTGVVCGEVRWGETEQLLGGRRLYAAHWTYRGTPVLDRIDLFDDAASADRSVPGCSTGTPLARVSN